MTVTMGPSDESADQESTSLQGTGSPDLVKVAIRKFQCRSGEIVSPPLAGITAIVGPNNSGKSTLLRELNEAIRFDRRLGQAPPSHIVETISLHQDGEPDDIWAWLAVNANWERQGPHMGYSTGTGVIIGKDNCQAMWLGPNGPGDSGIGDLGNAFTFVGDAHTRLQTVQPAPQRIDISTPAIHPLNKLEDDERLLEKVQEYCQRVFQQYLTLDRLSAETQLRLGKPSVEAPPIDRVTAEYRESLVALPPIQNQGDGMRCFLGILIPLICGSAQVAIIDEPEAYLHPPQARALGVILGELTREKKLQVFVATHVRSFLSGVIESGSEVAIVRLEREGSSTAVAELRPDDVGRLWRDPVLKYSNAIDGLFHVAVVLCEGDRDCRFYSAAMDVAISMRARSFVTDDVLFVPTGGKSGFRRLVSAFQAVKVPVVVIPDLDILNDGAELRVLFEQMSGAWEVISRDYEVATHNFRDSQPSTTVAQIAEKLDQVFAAHQGERRYDRDIEREIRAATAIQSRWNDLKQYGFRAFRGESAKAAMRLLESLELGNIVCVRDGELESLAPFNGSRKGNTWLTEALEQRAHAEQPALSHLTSVIDAIERAAALHN